MPLDLLPVAGSKGSILVAANTAGIISTIIESGLASLIELQTIYGAYDAYRLHELAIVKAYNSRPKNGDSY